MARAKTSFSYKPILFLYLFPAIAGAQDYLGKNSLAAEQILQKKLSIAFPSLKKPEEQAAWLEALNAFIQLKRLSGQEAVAFQQAQACKQFPCEKTWSKQDWQEFQLWYCDYSRKKVEKKEAKICL